MEFHNFFNLEYIHMYMINKDITIFREKDAEILLYLSETGV